MGHYRNWYPPYVSAAEKQRRSEKQAAALAKKEGEPLQPVCVCGRLMAKSFWGRAWCKNIESYQDYANRLPRGRSYVRNGSLLDLRISPGKVRAMVEGSSCKPHEINIDIKPLNAGRWEVIKQKCLGKISSLLELVQGKLPEDIIEQFCDRKNGLFPAPDEIKTSCSCPDWAQLCKHIAAVLYGIGARLDQEPRLFFTLRGVQESDLLGAQSVDSLTQGIDSEIDQNSLESVFGLELDSIDEALNSTGQKEKMPAQPEPAKSRPAKAAKPAKSRSAKAAKPALLEHWTAAQVASLRQSLGLTQGGLGSLIGVSAAQVSNWERGKISVTRRHWQSLQELESEGLHMDADERPLDFLALRKRLKMSRAALAAYLDVTPYQISKWEANPDISEEVRVKLRQLG